MKVPGLSFLLVRLMRRQDMRLVSRMRFVSSTFLLVPTCTLMKLKALSLVNKKSVVSVMMKNLTRMMSGRFFNSMKMMSNMMM